MKYIVVITMTIIAICIIPSDAASVYSFIVDVEHFYNAGHFGRCPSIETANIDVIFKGSDSSSVKSCASFNFKSLDETFGTKSFTLRFNRLNNGTLSSCASGGDTSMENLVFPCLSTPHLSSVDSSDLNFNVILYGRVIDPAGKRDVRCAMYTMNNSENYLMAVSSNKSCDGLQKMLPNQPEKDIKSLNWMMPLDESTINERRTRSTSNTKNSIKNFSGSRFFWRTG